MEWQPIETCPKNTRVLFYQEGQDIDVGQLVEDRVEYWERVSETRKELVKEIKVWCTCDNIYDATHWMPLPEPPK